MDIIHEDNNVIVINKKPGVLVHPDKYTKSGTLVDFLLGYYPKIAQVGESTRPGIVHRLDKDTSGLIICAKNQETYTSLVDQFKNKKVKKKYQTLTHGNVKDESGVITYSIAKKGRKQKLEAITYYKVIKYFKDFTLLDIEIKTGRMHQIRQHMKMFGYPVVGDPQYTFKNLKLAHPIKRHFLHSYYLKVELEGEEKEFKVDLPKDLKDYLEKLEK
ncbi:MAG: RNA pseudouridine synthase [Parcubacteria group bacterium]|nr:RNA pseudouridine synthase [Parcubacteria group bacterium]